MAKYLSIEQAARLVETAFSPLRCATEQRNFDLELGAQIYESSGKPIYTLSLKQRQFSNPGSLNSLIEQIRSLLEGNGFQLDSWTFQA